MERQIDDELGQFSTDLLKMAALTEEAIHKSVEALKGRDQRVAAEVIKDDERIDDFEIKIEEQGQLILARFQPMAQDLRYVTIALRINTDLERIADLAVNIAQRAIYLADLPPLKPLVDIPRLADAAKRMLRQAIDAFVKKDEEIARIVILSDKEANQLRTLIIQELIYNFMVKDGSTAPRAVPLILVARDLERICDLASNIAQEVIYMIQAKVVKHHTDELIK